MCYAVGDRRASGIDPPIKLVSLGVVCRKKVRGEVLEFAEVFGSIKEPSPTREPRSPNLAQIQHLPEQKPNGVVLPCAGCVCFGALMDGFTSINRYTFCALVMGVSLAFGTLASPAAQAQEKPTQRRTPILNAAHTSEEIKAQLHKLIDAVSLSSYEMRREAFRCTLRTLVHPRALGQHLAGDKWKEFSPSVQGVWAGLAQERIYLEFEQIFQTRAGASRWNVSNIQSTETSLQAQLTHHDRTLTLTLQTVVLPGTDFQQIEAFFVDEQLLAAGMKQLPKNWKDPDVWAQERIQKRRAIAKLQTEPKELLTAGCMSLQRGTMDKRTAEIAIKKRKPAVRYCYEQGMMNNRALQGRIVIQYEVFPGGSSNVAIHESTLQDPTTEACILDAVQNTPFPMPADAMTPLKLRYPFVLQKIRNPKPHPN